MFITVNTLPLVLEIGGLEKVGTFTGYYYTATFSAQLAAPIFTAWFACCPAPICRCSSSAHRVRAVAVVHLAGASRRGDTESVIKEAEMQDA
jgi:hypothetical protein